MRILLETMEDEFRKEGYEVLSVVTDVTSKESVENMVQKVIGSFGRIDIFVNYAGVMHAAGSNKFL